MSSERSGAGDAGAAPAPPPPVDAEKLIAAINEASKRELTNWFTFLTLGTYLAVAVGATTHRQLFLEQPVKLPLFNVDLPLVAFFVVAPTLFVIFHFYVLLQLQLLTERIRAGIASFAAAEDREDRLVAFGRRLDTFHISQLLVVQGDRLARLALYAITWITLIAAPVLLLLIFQLSFLPYHDAAITWVHRALVVADLLLVCFLEPRLPNVLQIIRRDWNPFAIPRRPSVAGVLISAAIAYVSIVVATIPDEAVERELGMAEAAVTLRSQLFSDGIDLVRGRPQGLFARRLVLNDQDFVDLGDAALAAAERTVVLRGRDLRLAVLDRTDLRKADFTAADLRGASFIAARLDGASFGCARDPSPAEADDFDKQGRPGCVRLDDARFDGVSAARARFDWASASRVRFASADLTGAGFWRAELRQADFGDAKLPGARLPEARLAGANFLEACAVGADLRAADAFGARFIRADFRGANFINADLVISNWDGADLRRTDLRLAFLAAATMAGADLRGAAVGARGLDATMLRGALLEEAWIDDPPGIGLVDLGEYQAPFMGRRPIAVGRLEQSACDRFAAQDKRVNVAALLEAAPGTLRDVDARAPADWRTHWEAAKPVDFEQFVKRMEELVTDTGACADGLRDVFYARLSEYHWGIGGQDIRRRLRALCP